MANIFCNRENSRFPDTEFTPDHTIHNKAPRHYASSGQALSGHRIDPAIKSAIHAGDLLEVDSDLHPLWDSQSQQWIVTALPVEDSEHAAQAAELFDEALRLSPEDLRVLLDELRRRRSQ